LPNFTFPPEGERVEQPMRPNAMKRDFTGQLSEAKLLRAVESERQLQEVMVDLWFNTLRTTRATRRRARRQGARPLARPAQVSSLEPGAVDYPPTSAD
jgi:hypothetical protein